jgi:hypothetical protein
MKWVRSWLLVTVHRPELCCWSVRGGKKQGLKTENYRFWMKHPIVGFLGSELA